MSQLITVAYYKQQSKKKLLLELIKVNILDLFWIKLLVQQPQLFNVQGAQSSPKHVHLVAS